MKTLKYLLLVLFAAQSSIAQTPTWQNQNKVFRDIGIEQGIEACSVEWDKGGIKPYSGTTGGHYSYGWNHKYLLSEKWVPAVLANYMMRPSFYLNAPMRMTGYENAGRPLGYVPELSGDELDGQVSYFTTKGICKVSGPDVLHYQLGPLFAVADSKGYKVQVQGKSMAAETVAKITITNLVKSLAGMLTQKSGKLTTYIWGDRGSSLIMAAATEAGKRALIDQEDQAKIFTYLIDYEIPFFEKAPGLSLNNKPATVDGLPNQQLYNGLYWLLPRFYDALQIAPAGDMHDRLAVIVKRWSQYMEDLEVLKPGQSTMCWAVTFPPAVIAGKAGKPLDTWKGVLTADNCEIEPKGTDWSQWGLRAQYVAAKVLGSDLLKAAADKNLAKWKAKGGDKVWLVGADGEYLE